MFYINRFFSHPLKLFDNKPAQEWVNHCSAMSFYDNMRAVNLPEYTNMHSSNSTLAESKSDQQTSSNELDARLDALEASGVTLDNLHTIMRAKPQDQQLLYALLYIRLYKKEDNQFNLFSLLHIIGLKDLLPRLLSEDRVNFIAPYATSTIEIQNVEMVLNLLQPAERLPILKQMQIVRPKSYYLPSTILSLIDKKDRSEIVERNNTFICSEETLADVLAVLPVTAQDSTAQKHADKIISLKFLLKLFEQFPAIDKFEFTLRVDKKVLTNGYALPILKDLLIQFHIEQRFIVIDQRSELPELHYLSAKTNLIALLGIFTPDDQIKFIDYYCNSFFYQEWNIINILKASHQASSLELCIKYLKNAIIINLATFSNIVANIPPANRLEIIEEFLEKIINKNQLDWNGYYLLQILNSLASSEVQTLALKYIEISAFFYTPILILLPNEARLEYCRKLLDQDFDTPFTQLLPHLAEDDQFTLLSERHDLVKTQNDLSNILPLVHSSVRLELISLVEKHLDNPLKHLMGTNLEGVVNLLPVPACFIYLLNNLERGEYTFPNIKPVYDRSDFNSPGQAIPVDKAAFVTWLKFTIDSYKLQSESLMAVMLESQNEIKNDAEAGRLDKDVITIIHSYVLDIRSSQRFFNPAEGSITSYIRAGEDKLIADFQEFYQTTLAFTEVFVSAYQKLPERQLKNNKNHPQMKALLYEKDFMPTLTASLNTLALACLAQQPNHLEINEQLQAIASSFATFNSRKTRMEIPNLPKPETLAFAHYLLELQQIKNAYAFEAASKKLTSALANNRTLLGAFAANTISDEEEKKQETGRRLAS
jgi:hypothetical protein